MFEVTETDALERIVEPALHVWLSERKDLDLDKLSARWTDGRSCRATRVSAQGKHGDGAVTRVVLEEASGYVTTVTLTAAHTKTTQVWIEIDSPVGKPPAKPPQLVRSILGQVTAFDASSTLPDAPRLYGTQDVEQLTGQINDEHRQFPVLVAGSSEEVPLTEWRAYVTNITRDTCGMANLVVLTPTATTAFEALHGAAGFSVPAGTIRTFLPGTHVEDESDAPRNKILGTTRLIRDSEAYLTRVLAAASRRSATTMRLARTERDAERALRRSTAEQLLGFEHEVSRATPNAGVAIERVAPSSTTGPFRRRKADTGPTLDGPARKLGAGIVNKLVRVVVHAFEDKWARGKFDERAIESIELALRRDPEAARRDQEQVLARIDEQQEQFEFAQLELADASERLADLDLDLAAAQERTLERDARIRFLEKQLAIGATGADAYREQPSDPRASAPTSFAELIDRQEDFGGLAFTCDWEIVASLDETVHAPASRVGGIWEGLVALDDYTRAKLDNKFSGSLYEYLRSTPPGYATISLERYAATESETVQQSPRLRGLRTFPVPPDIDPSGMCIMLAHIKKGNDTTDPRLYLHDASAKTGRVIIGYVGPHLDVKGTN